MTDPDLAEVSGLVASRAHPGVYYAHADSGDGPRFFAMDAKGKQLGEFKVGNATATDWEDIGLGPCPAGQCVYLADFGDNGLQRKNYKIWRVPEPQVAIDKPVGTVSVTAEKLAYAYPGGKSYNAETLLVTPDTGDVYVVTKHGGGTPSTVFRMPKPHDPKATVTLVEVTKLAGSTADSPMTGGDVHPCGRQVLLRTYGKLYLFTAPAGQPLDAAFSLPHLAVPVAKEVQGEAVAWRADGLGWLTLSEGGSQPLWQVTCQP